MAVSHRMLFTLLAVYQSTEESFTGVMAHTKARYKIDVKPNTFNALENRGYLEIYRFDNGIYYRVTDKGKKYLVRYHKDKLQIKDLQSYFRNK